MSSVLDAVILEDKRFPNKMFDNNRLQISIYNSCEVLKISIRPITDICIDGRDLYCGLLGRPRNKVYLFARILIYREVSSFAQAGAALLLLVLVVVGKWRRGTWHQHSAQPPIALTTRRANDNDDAELLRHGINQRRSGPGPPEWNAAKRLLMCCLLCNVCDSFNDQVTEKNDRKITTSHCSMPTTWDKKWATLFYSF